MAEALDPKELTDFREVVVKFWFPEVDQDQSQDWAVVIWEIPV